MTGEGVTCGVVRVGVVLVEEDRVTEWGVETVGMASWVIFSDEWVGPGVERLGVW